LEEPTRPEIELRLSSHTYSLLEFDRICTALDNLQCSQTLQKQ
jgi:hypothetical protein